MARPVLLRARARDIVPFQADDRERPAPAS
jgi:hypothetical protein